MNTSIKMCQLTAADTLNTICQPSTRIFYSAARKLAQTTRPRCIFLCSPEFNASCRVKTRHIRPEIGLQKSVVRLHVVSMAGYLEECFKLDVGCLHWNGRAILESLKPSERGG